MDRGKEKSPTVGKALDSYYEGLFQQPVHCCLAVGLALWFCSKGCGEAERRLAQEPDPRVSFLPPREHCKSASSSGRIKELQPVMCLKMLP